MSQDPLVLGIDLGTSGVRIAVIDSSCALLQSESAPYKIGLINPFDWRDRCCTLIGRLNPDYRHRLKAIAVDGTSGTLLACDQQGLPLAEALPYSFAYPNFIDQLQTLSPQGGPASSASGSLARALHLVEQHSAPLLLRHQADWISGWLLENWSHGEEGNNLRLGWDLSKRAWPDSFISQPWWDALPEISASGSVLGLLSPQRAKDLDLPEDLLVVAGTTDSNAAVLTADADDDEGITVLGSTLVLKRFTDQPIAPGPGTSSHRVGGRWLCGGASNAGAAVLKQLFPDIDLAELSRQIDPDQDSGLRLRPLPSCGERFPVDDPQLEPILTPRPVSDALYLHSLLEGLTAIEHAGWQRLTSLGADPPMKSVTLGGGARNPQWRRLRERQLGVPIRSCNTPPAAGVARLALKAVQAPDKTIHLGEN
jgi:xylulokinase